MFNRASDASKVALAHLVRSLTAWGYALIDCQVYTPHLASLGAVEIPRAEFQHRLAERSTRPSRPRPGTPGPGFCDRLPSSPTDGRAGDQPLPRSRALLPYLPGRTALSAFVDPALDLSPAIFGRLLEQGFRRSGPHVYRPMCPDCTACRAVRIPVEAFRRRRSQRRAATCRWRCDCAPGPRPRGVSP